MVADAGWVRDGLVAGGVLRDFEVTTVMPSKQPWIKRGE